MSQRDVIWNSAKFIGTISVVAATVIPVSAQQRPTSPVAAAPVENRYPDGSKLQSQYSSAQRSVVLPSAAPSVRANSAGFASAAAVQTDLPEGFSLLAAPTSHVGGTDQPVGANMAPATAADRVASSTEKFVTVFPLAYRGVPLSKGSDYLTIVDGNGQIQATRKRAMPSKVDATQPTVSTGEAIQVARRDAGAASAGPDPKPELQVWVDDQQNGNLSWTFTLGPRAAGDPNVRKYWVAAVGEPRVLNWESEVYHTHNGVVSGNIWAASPFQATESRAFPSLEVSRLLPNEKAITNAEGRYGYTTPGASTEIRAKLRGPWFIVNNQSGAGLERPRQGQRLNRSIFIWAPATRINWRRTPLFIGLILPVVSPATSSDRPSFPVCRC